MTTLVWSTGFVRRLKRKLRQNPELKTVVEQTLIQLADDPFHNSLKSHKLSGKLTGVWACRVAYDLRILFEFVENPDTKGGEILLLTIGSHDEVY